MQEIIVYRSPAEAAMWKALEGGQLFPVIAGIVAFFVAFLLLEKLLPSPWAWASMKRRSRWVPARTNLTLTLGAIVGVIVCWWLWL